MIPAATPDAICVVVTTFPGRDEAERTARILVEERLAACIHLLPKGVSIYQWEGRLNVTEEVTLLIKTTTTAYAALEQRLRALHSYALPEIMALPVTAGLPDYLAWVAAAVREG
ncbi:MAG: divalent-cation tolerance protein CutA [Acidithiobacillus sp.]|uniref:divalent-cation tolerance protein CutA n=1 Tax=Acidithiobacillus sp. TaxID=1872118 RepID=UPI003D00CA09